MILNTASHLIQFGSSSYDSGSSIVTDSFGNAYVTAQTDSGIDGHTNARSNDIFIIKLTNAGIKLWTRKLGTSSNEYGYGIATDPSGNVYVTGYTEGNLDGNNNAGGNDVFVVKYDVLAPCIGANYSELLLEILPMTLPPIPIATLM